MAAVPGETNSDNTLPTILFGAFGTAIGLATIFIGFLQVRDMRRRSKRIRSIEEGHELPPSTSNNATPTSEIHSESASGAPYSFTLSDNPQGGGDKDHEPITPQATAT